MSTIDEMTLTHLYPNPPQQQEEGKLRRRRQKAEAVGFEARKRKLTQHQIDVLELNFKDEHKLECEKKERLAIELGLEPRQVAVWFQNRRARYKCQKLEEEFSQLKAQHESVVAQKSQLQSEILKLKEQLSSVEKMSHNLIAERHVVDGYVSSNSTSSPFSMDSIQEADHFLGNFTMGGIDNAFYAPEYNYSYSSFHGSNGWVNLFEN